MSNLTEEIWQRAVEGRPHRTAEDRAAIDRALRDELAAISDDILRGHVRELLASKRSALFRGTDGRSVAARVAALENAVFGGEKP